MCIKSPLENPTNAYIIQELWGQSMAFGVNYTANPLVLWALGAEQ